MANVGTTTVAIFLASVAVLLTTSIASDANADGLLADLLRKYLAQLELEEKEQLQSRVAGDTPIDVSQNLKRGLTDAQKARAVYLHNFYRSKEGGSDMNKLVWSDQLAQIAQEWSEKCVFEHRALGNKDGVGYVSPDSVGFPGAALGENLWVGSANQFLVPDAGIEGWYNEKTDYTYSSMYCTPGKMCGHYIAVAWGPSVAVGCGFAQCDSVQLGDGNTYPGGVMMTCNYAPGVLSGQRPFKLGPPCSECSSGKMFCTDNLCDNSCTAVGSAGNCECNTNCGRGTLVTSTCSCRCDAGYTGLRCDAVCEDKDSKCGNGWPVSFCNKEEMLAKGYLQFHYRVVDSCPKLCGKCVAAKRHTDHRFDKLLSQLLSDHNYRRENDD